ncbi:MAG: dockerin type I domain-containing protein [candidate division Zixibacteria bacterium]|nr:dockerin type I domain-containing protein [candidate division Zixibacteria bacterium]
MKRLTLMLGIIFFVLSAISFAQTSQKSVDQKIAELQKIIDQKGYHWIAGRNWTSELSDEELIKLLGYKPPRGYKEWLEKQPKLKAKAGMVFPSVFDWRDRNDTNYVTSVKDQDGCGSCWDFAATGAFEAAIKIHDYTLEYDLSEQQVLSCNIYADDGCNGAWAEAAYELFQRYGAILETSMPYQANDNVPCTQDLYPVVAKLKGWQYVDNDVDAIKTALLSGPVYSTFDVYTDFFYYSSGCYQHTWGGYEGGHAIVIVGWDDNSCGTGQGAWICKNSWATDWGGLGGYFYIKWGDCDIGRSTVLPLYPPDPVTLSYENHQVSETVGDGDGILEPGETITLAVDLKNSGPQTATSVSATLSTASPGITITDNVATFPDIPFNEIKSSIPPHFTFQIDPSAEKGTRVDFDLNITSSEGLFSGSLYDFVGKFDTVFADDMEGSDNGWTHGYFESTDDWQHGQPTGGSLTDPDSAHSGVKIWGNNLSGNYPDMVYNYLESPVINCLNMEKTRLWFYRWLAVEKAEWDTAAIYVNGNRVWMNDHDYDNLDYKWQFQDIDISAYADSNLSVQVRFELNSDEGLHLGGWNIDDFTIVGIHGDYIVGDANNDEKLTVSDVIYLINYLFKGGVEPSPWRAGDTSCDGKVNVSDVIYLINYLVKFGPAPGC